MFPFSLSLIQHIFFYPLRRQVMYLTCISKVSKWNEISPKPLTVWNIFESLSFNIVIFLSLPFYYFAIESNPQSQHRGMQQSSIWLPHKETHCCSGAQAHTHAYVHTHTHTQAHIFYTLPRGSPGKQRKEGLDWGPEFWWNWASAAYTMLFSMEFNLQYIYAPTINHRFPSSGTTFTLTFTF